MPSSWNRTGVLAETHERYHNEVEEMENAMQEFVPMPTKDFLVNVAMYMVKCLRLVMTCLMTSTCWRVMEWDARQPAESSMTDSYAL